MIDDCDEIPKGGFLKKKDRKESSPPGMYSKERVHEYEDNSVNTNEVGMTERYIPLVVGLEYMDP
jgi:hypothetical protein